MDVLDRKVRWISKCDEKKEKRGTERGHRFDEKRLRLIADLALATSIRCLRASEDTLRPTGVARGDSEFRSTRYDRSLSEHLRKHGGWSAEAREQWALEGKSASTAERRIGTLRSAGLLDRHYQPTRQFDRALRASMEREEKRLVSRREIVKGLHSEHLRSIEASLSKRQLALVDTLARFRQMTPGQARRLGCSGDDIKGLMQNRLVTSRTVFVQQRPLALLTLTPQRGNNRYSDVSGQEFARKRLGLPGAFAGVHRDHAKILHDVSVVDAAMHARDRFERAGYTFQGWVTEHMAYSMKENSNSDLGACYADAYLVFSRGGGGETTTVAVEFGNYRPSYLQEKLQHIEADHVLIYAHGEERAHAYEAIVPETIASRTEIYSLESPLHQGCREYEREVCG